MVVARKSSAGAAGFLPKMILNSSMDTVRVSGVKPRPCVLFDRCAMSVGFVVAMIDEGRDLGC